MFNFKAFTISLTVLIGLTAQTVLYAKGQSHISYEYVPVISATPVSKIIQHSTPTRTAGQNRSRLNNSDSTSSEQLF